MRSLLVFSLLGALTLAQEADIDTAIKDVFGPGGDDTAVPEAPPVPPAGGTGEGGDCECVPFYLCENGTIIEDGKGLIDIRFGDRTCDSLNTCCKQGSVLTEPIISQPEPIHVSPCGKRNVDGVGFRIVGDKDNEAQFGEFPWMAAILKEEVFEDGRKLNMYTCGGSLIHKHVVLTAAHCVYKKPPETIKVRVGEWDTQTKSELYPHQDRSVVKIIVHEKYYKGGLHNDVALVITDKPFDYAENVDIVCLPKQGEVALNNDCFASGWGKDLFGQEGNYQVILKRVQLPMIPRDKCQTALRQTRLGSHFTLHESFVCAGGQPGKDTCKGDGGGPLVCPIAGKKDHYQVIGMVAWGIGCGEGTPGVYVHVAHFRNWIDEHLKKLNYKIEY